jgi:hypothetical protein
LQQISSRPSREPSDIQSADPRREFSAKSNQSLTGISVFLVAACTWLARKVVHKKHTYSKSRLQEHRVEAARLDVPLRPLEASAQGQEPGGVGRAV